MLTNRNPRGALVTIILGLVITLVCMLGGFMAMGGHVWCSGSRGSS